MRLLLEHLRQFVTRPHVRPWGLAVPVAVLLVALPLLRPLRHPEQMSREEEQRLAAIQTLVERGQTKGLSARAGEQPPVMTLLLSGPYFVMHRLGFTLDRNVILVPYLLTVLGVTLPVAAAAGLVYRMGRVFELRRPWRMLLAFAAVFASGLISYAVVLNAQAPAAALMLAASAGLVHVAASPTPHRGGAWLLVAGFCAALAATIEPLTGVFLVLLAMVILAMRWRPSLRLAGVLLYLLGTTPPLLLHLVLIQPTEPPVSGPPRLFSSNDQTTEPAASPDEQELAGDLPWQVVGETIAKVLAALLGGNGLLSHFPILLLGIAGIAGVMHRHWPATTKTLATATLLGIVVLLLLTALHNPRWLAPAFAARWAVVFVPLLLFWAGAWARRPHHPVVWATAAVLLIFSTVVSLLGATGPMPRQPMDGYTAWAALDNLRHLPAAPLDDVAMTTPNGH